MKRKLLIILMVLVLLTLLPSTALAEDIFADGTGADDDPYVIETVEQLADFRDSVNSGTTYVDKYIELVEGRIYDLSNLNKDWTPIGYAPENPFSGHFDGKGATITGLKMTKTDSENTDIFYGLFGIVNGTSNNDYTATTDIFDVATGELDEGPIAEEKYSAVVKNLVLENVSITTDGSWVGALAGGSYHAYFSNIHVDDGSVIGTNSIGGVLGRGYGTVLNNVYTGSELTVGSGDNTEGSVYNFGGIVGSLRVYDSALCAVINSTNNATVDAYLSAGGLGGIVGMTPSNEPIVIYGCTNNGDLSVKDTINVAGTTAYHKIVGGIGGQIQGNNDNVIANCTNNGNISGGTAGYPVGALAGMANYYSGLIYNCTNTGDIAGCSYYSAGMVGHGGEVTVVKSENSGKIATDLAVGYASTITAGISTATYQDMAFADVEELAAALIKAAKTANTLVDTAAKLTLHNVTVADNSGTLELPQFLGELTADSKLCDEIIIGDRTVNNSALYQNNINVTLGVPGAAVSLPEDKTIAGKLTLCGDNMSLINKGTITNLMLNGKGIEAINLNAISASAVISGDDAVFYNGTAENSAATLQRFETTAKNTVAYNYGTINRGVDGGHALQFGNPQTPGTTAVFHNYGTVIGGGSGNSPNYIIYAPRFDNVKVVNYADSTMQKGGHWFITYGSDDSPNTTGEFAGSKGIFIFQYAENTVKDNDSNIVNDINENNFVGRNNTDLDLRIIKIATIDDPVATVNGVPVADLASAFASAGAGEEVVLVKESVELTEAIPEGVTLVVPEGKSLNVPQDNMATVLGSTGTLRVAAGGSVALAGNQLIGSSGMANITAGNVDIQLADRAITLNTGAAATVPAGQTLNLLFAAGMPIDATINNGALLIVEGTLKIPATGDGASLTVDGALQVNNGGLVWVGSKATLNGRGTVSNDGNITLHKGADTSAALDINITLEPDGVVYSQLTNAAIDAKIKNSTKTTSIFTVPGVEGDDATPLEFTTKYTYYVYEPAGTTKYQVTVEDSDNGTVTISPKNASAGSIVTITVKADDGYVLDDLIVTDNKGNEIKITDKGNGKYTFKMPASKVTVEASFRLDVCDGGRDCPSYGFSDVDHSLWYHEAVDYAIEQGLMNGTSATTFAPNGTLSRAMLAQILYNLEGRPSLEDEILGYPYADVPGDAWFADAVYWARLNNVILGYGDETFGPNDPIIREQLMTILYRYEQLQGGGFSGAWAYALDFADAGQVSEWAYEASCWCTMNGVITGYGNDMLIPQGNATRAEVAQMMMRFLELER